MEEEIVNATQMSFLEMLLSSGPVVQFVLVTLIILSIWSWALTIAKILQFRRANAESNEFQEIFEETRNLDRVDDTSRRLTASPLSNVFAVGFRELNRRLQRASGPMREEDELRSVEIALRRAETAESQKLERGITFLATVASSAPFIGLFGTVVGIMRAFHGLSFAKNTTIQAVAPGISEALFATAVGLAAAIPAAIAYNFFSVAVRKYRNSMESFSDEFMALARAALSK